MTKMIVGMNYLDSGERIIAFLAYNINWSEEALAGMAGSASDNYDEVYIVDFNPNHKDFINEIVLKGCRL